MRYTVSSNLNNRKDVTGLNQRHIFIDPTVAFMRNTKDRVVKQVIAGALKYIGDTIAPEVRGFMEVILTGSIVTSDKLARPASTRP